MGGALIPVLGYSWLYLIDTFTLFATFYAVWKLPPLPVEGEGVGTPGLRSVIDGLKYLSLHHILLVSFVVDLIAMVFGLPRVLFPEIAHEQFGGPAGGGLEFALLYAAMPAGTVIGGVFSGWVSRIRRYGAAVLWAIAAWGLAVLLFGIAVGFAPQATTAMLVVACAMLIAGGAADMASMAFRQSILLDAADDKVRGRLQGVFIVVVAGGPRIADVLHGGASELFGPALTSAGGGALVLVGIALAGLMFPSFRRFRRGDDA